MVAIFPEFFWAENRFFVVFLPPSGFDSKLSLFGHLQREGLFPEIDGSFLLLSLTVSERLRELEPPA